MEYRRLDWDQPAPDLSGGDYGFADIEGDADVLGVFVVIGVVADEDDIAEVYRSRVAADEAADWLRGRHNVLRVRVVEA